MGPSLHPLNTTHERILFSRVVFPEPRYPVRMVVGTVVRLGGMKNRATRDFANALVVKNLHTPGWPPASLQKKKKN
jgi:hypothetical protein